MTTVDHGPGEVTDKATGKAEGERGGASLAPEPTPILMSVCLSVPCLRGSLNSQAQVHSLSNNRDWHVSNPPWDKHLTNFKLSSIWATCVIFPFTNALTNFLWNKKAYMLKPQKTT